jgi:DNA-binding NarL/FixJ family response regulator
MKLSRKQISKIEKKYRLTEKEIEVLKVIFEGASTNKEIAGITETSFRTIGIHLQNIYKKVGENKKHTIVLKILEDIL